VFLGGEALPLYYVSPTQINALIPAGLAANTQQQLLVVRDATQSVGIPVTVAEVQPGIYTANQQGTGQAAVLISGLGIVAAPAGAFPGSRPAMRGENVEIYATGLGAVDNPPPDGTPAPTSSLTRTLQTPSVTVGGISATTQFSGLAPGLVGVYQVNIQVPSNAPVGGAIPIVLQVGQSASNSVTIAIQ